MIGWSNEVKLNTRIDVYEKEFEVKLPEDLKQIIENHNKAHIIPNCFKTKNGEEIIVKHFLSFNKEDKLSAYFCKRLEQIPKDVFPFAVDPFGNFICLQNSKIVFFDSETESYDFICNSVTELLNNLCE